MALIREQRARALRDAAAEVLSVDHLSTEQLETLLSRAGRVNGPALLFDAWPGRKISRETLAAVIGDVWSSAEYPEPTLGRRNWVHLFREAGYTADGEPAERPANALTLYRGAPYRLRRRMSWTAELARAEWFAERYNSLHPETPGAVWVATVP
ncbi:MAG TPA: hypothetical protein VK390_03075, partial [Propionibacteriaceae bacterium]|nr:hypothetical protein [Propionibacteriaceae bacterium]